VARANFSTAVGLLHDVLHDFQAHGINEAVNHNHGPSFPSKIVEPMVAPQ
jgi:hypothetical protein